MVRKEAEMRCNHDCFRCPFPDCVVERITPEEVRQIEAREEKLTGRKGNRAASWEHKMKKQKEYRKANQEKIRA